MHWYIYRLLVGEQTSGGKEKKESKHLAAEPKEFAKTELKMGRGDLTLY